MVCIKTMTDFSSSEWSNKIESDKLARYYRCWLRMRLEVEQWKVHFCMIWELLSVWLSTQIFLQQMEIFTHLPFVKMQCFLLQWWSVVQCWPCGKSGQEMPQLMRVVAKIAWSSHPQKMWILAQHVKIAELKIHITKCHILTSIATNVFLDEKVIPTNQESPHNHP